MFNRAFGVRAKKMKAKNISNAEPAATTIIFRELPSCPRFTSLSVIG
jgi:hypothetical protein